LPEEFVEQLRARGNLNGVQQLPTPAYASGHTVLISDGVMAGYEAVFVARSGTERVILLLSIASIEARVQLPLTQIEPFNEFLPSP
jgi:hypothetical protein